MEIILKNLQKTYKGKDSPVVTAVKDVSLNIPSNRIFGIIGKSGAGKSSLVRLISLLETPDSGEVWYDSERVDNLSEKEIIQRRRRIGMIFQNFNLFSSRSVGENVAYPMEICKVNKTKIKERVAQMLELVGLSDRVNAPVSTLSGGQKQRVAIARALANQPDILFCDEATSALDPQTTHSILDLIREIQKKMNLTVVMITHQMEVVRDACSQVAVIDEGKVVEQGSVEQIFMHPQAEVTREFLSHLQMSDSSHEGEEDKKLVRWSEKGGNYILHFKNQATDEPVLSRIAHKFNIEFNIRAGGIHNLPDCKIGQLVTDITGDEQEVSKAFEYLKEQGINIEKTETGEFL